MNKASKIAASSSHSQAATDFAAGSMRLASSESSLQIDHSPRMLAQRRQIEKIQRSPRMLLQKEQAERLSQDAERTSSPAFLVDDDALPAPGQVSKETFLSALRMSVRQMADGVLAEIGQSADDCPYIAYWFSYYKDKDAAHIEEAIGRYAPEAMHATEWQQCIALVTAQVREGFEKHVASGSLEGVPDELPVLEPENKSPEPAPEVVQQSAAPIQLCGSADDDSDHKKPAPKGKTALTVKEKERPTKEERSKAIAAFKNASIVNFTDVMYQFVTKIVSSSGGISLSGEWTGKPKDHVVNKWERVDEGEKNMSNYDKNDKSLQGGERTNAAEAKQLGIDSDMYFDLASQYKMQFAMLDYKNDPSKIAQVYGKSYFSINKEKCQNDGFIHFGDSGVTAFNRNKGAYKDFEEKLEADDEAVWILSGKKSVEWIEVNLKGGVALPEEVDKFVVNKGELQNAANLKTDNVNLTPDEKYQAAEKALNTKYGDKVEIR